MMKKASLRTKAFEPKWLLPALLILALLVMAACGGAPGGDQQSTDPEETDGEPAAKNGQAEYDYDWLFGDLVHPWNTEVAVGRARVAVLNVTADAWPELSGTGVVPPQDDHQYVLFRLRVTNASDETINVPLDLVAGYSDKDGNLFQRPEKLLEEPCWNVPGGVWDDDNAELAPGETKEINVCIEVPEESVSGGLVGVQWMVLGELAGAFFQGVR